MTPSPSQTTSTRTTAIILAAGQSTRMKSAIPKPLHPVAGLPMGAHVVNAARDAGISRFVFVAGPEMDDLPALLGAPGSPVVIQHDRRGTGDATQLAFTALEPDVDVVLVLFADHPQLDGETIEQLLAGSLESGAPVTVLTAIYPGGGSYGRIARDDRQRVIGIVEEKDDDLTLRVGDVEINSGMMALNVAWAREPLLAIPESPTTGELYLTALVAGAANDATDDAPWPIETVKAPLDAALGVNNRQELARANSAIYERIREQLMSGGVSMIGPETSFIDARVRIGQDTTILPYCVISGNTTVGERCTIGPGAVIHNSQIADDARVVSSTLRDAVIGSHSDVGPYSHLRAGTRIGEHVHVGNFAEIKNSTLASGVRDGHFGYLGDAEIGEDVNIGAGTVTANYDGKDKFPTTIKAGAFIGSDTILRAPVTIGENARTGAGSVVTRDVPAGTTVVGAPARALEPKPRGHGEENS